jgi:hypothetical protein
MSQAHLVYRHNAAPRRGLATAGIFLLKFVLAIPHLIVINALNGLAFAVSYIGYWVIAFTGEMPQMVTKFVPMTLDWNARAYGWIIGLDDAYPPFSTDAAYSVSVESPTNESPSKGWAVAGLLAFPKALAAIPHIVVMVFLMVGAFFATWFGYFAVAFTGSFPAGIQDFTAGVMQWNMRVWAWFAGLTDEYPPFSLEAEPTA